MAPTGPVTSTKTPAIGQYHAWAYTDGRRRQLRLVERKELQYDGADVPAVWNSHSAAYQWATNHTKHGFKVMRCDCQTGQGFPHD